MAAVKIIGKVAVKVMPDTADFKGALKRDLDRIEREIGKMQVEVIPKITKAAEDKVKADLKALTERLSGKNIDLDPNLDDRRIGTVEAALDALTRDRTVNIDVDYNAVNALLLLSGARPQIEAWRDMAKTLSNLDQVAISAATLATKLGAVSIGAVSATGEIASLGSALAGIGPAALALPGIFGGMALGTIAWGVAMKDFNKHLPEFAIGMGRNVDAGTAWKKMQDSMSGKFWAGAEENIQNLVGNLFPEFRKGMNAISTDLGVFTGNLAGSLSGKLDGTLKGMFDDLGRSIEITAEHTDALANIFATLGRVGAGFLPQLAQWFAGLSEQFSAFLANTGDVRLTQWVQDGVTQLKALGSVIANLGSIFSGFAAAATAAGGTSLVLLAANLDRIANTVNSAAFQTGLTSVFESAYQAVRNFSDAAGPGLQAVILKIRDLFNAIAPDLGATLGNVVGALTSALTDPQISSGIMSLFNGIEVAAANLVPTFEPLAQMLGSLGPVLAALLINISAIGAAGVDKLAPTFQKITTAIVPVINNLGQMFLKIGTDMAPVFQVIGEKIAELITHFNPLIAAVQKFWNMIAPVLIPALKVVVSIIGDSLIGVITGVTMVFNGLTKIIGGVVTFFKGLWDVIAGLFTLDFGRIGEGLGKMFDGVWDILVGTLEAIAGGLWAWMNGSILAPFKTLGLKLLGPLGKLFDPIMKALAKVKDFISPFFNWIFKGAEDGVKATGSVWSRITDVLKYPFERALDAIKAIWAGLKSVFGPVFEVVSTIVKTYVEVWVTIFKTAFEVLKVVFTTAWAVISTIFKVAFEVIGTVLRAAWTGIVDFFTTTMDGIYFIFSGPWTAISEFLTALWTSIKAGAMLIWDALRVWFDEMFAGMQVRIETIWNGISGFFTAIWDGIKAVFSGAGDGIKTALSAVWDFIKAKTGAVWDWITSKLAAVWSSITSRVGAALDWYRSKLADAWDFIKSKTEGIWNSIRDKINDAWESIKSKVSSAASSIKSAMSDAWDAIKSAVSSAWDSIKSTVTDKIGDVIDLVKGIPGKAKNALAGIGAALINAGTQLIQGLIDGITEKVKDLKAKLGEVTKLIPDWKGPPEKDATLLTNAGRLIMDGLIDGLDSRLGNLRSMLQGVTSVITDELSGSSNYQIGIAANLDTSNRGLSQINGLAKTISVSAANAGDTADSGSVHIDNITIPLEDLQQLKSLEDFLDMLRVRTRQGVLA